MAGRLLLPLVLLYLLLLLSATSESPDADALLKFKAALSDPADFLHDWDPASEPCNRKAPKWTGVTCESDGSVSGLRLDSMGLSGSIAVGALARLLRLRTLSLINNSFEGTMPEVGRISGLRTVFLSMNKFAGGIPDAAFDGMSWLKKLYLSQNGLSGPIPATIAELPKLLELGLDGNMLSGAIPDMRSKELKLVNLKNNELEGRIPESLSNMKADTFSGNKGLCGEPLGVPCPPALATTSSSSSSSSSPSSPSFEPIAVVGLSVCAILVFISFVFLVRSGTQDTEPQVLPNNSKLAAMKAKKLEEGAATSDTSSTCSARKVDQVKLIFVREVKERFELRNLLKSSAEVLGTASFGCAYKARLPSGTPMVVKSYRHMNRVGKEDFEEHMRRLGRLSHPNLLPLVAYYYRKDEKLLVTDYVPRKCLASILHGSRSSGTPIDRSTRIKIVKGVAKGLNYLYEELQMLTVTHGHLRSSNVLVSDSFEPLLTDFALAPVVNQAQAMEFMAAYRSPECQKSGKPTKKSDIWCLGILILEILTGKPPATDLKQDKGGVDLVNWVNSVAQEEWRSKVLDSQMQLTAKGEEEAIKLLQIGLACCVEDADKRLALEEVLDRIEALKERGGEAFVIKMQIGN